MKNSFNRRLFVSLAAITAGLLIAVAAMAWTSPSGTPPAGGGVIYYSGGNVGIGTSTPGYPLTVVGAIYSSTGGFRFPDNTTQTTAASAGLGGGGTINYIGKFTGTGTIGNSVIFDNGTNVGIGTASPTTGKLVVSGGSVDVTTNKIINLATPTESADAATKGYVDAAGGGGSYTAWGTTSCATGWTAPYTGSAVNSMATGDDASTGNYKPAIGSPICMTGLPSRVAYGWISSFWSTGQGRAVGDTFVGLISCALCVK